MRKSIYIFVGILFYTNSFSQNITNLLGSSGLFTIKDNTNTFFTVNQSNGRISLITPASGDQTGSIFKGSFPFLHTYYGSGTNGANTFLGINSGNLTMSGSSSWEGSYNTGVGYQSLTSLTTGSYNSALGVLSLYSNTTGEYNSALGYQSLFTNTTGSYNSAFGYYSLYYSLSGDENSAYGYESLFSNTTGYENSAFGVKSLSANTTGYYNSAFGYQALNANTTGTNNSAFGYQSLYSSTGNYNCAFGFAAGAFITGSNNITIGYNAQVPSLSSDNQIRIGNTSITYAGVEVSWTVTSDRRWKDKIQTSSLGLDFISKLNPVSYTRKNDYKQRTEFGLIAQELEEVLKEFNIENSGMLTTDDDGYYHLRYNDLLSPMIKAMQELRMKNEELRISNEKRITELKNENIELKKQLSMLEQMQNKIIGEIALIKLNNSENVQVSIEDSK